MVTRPKDVNPFEFVIVASLRAQQLIRGCAPRVPGTFKRTTLAQLEVAGGKIGATRPAGYSVP